MSCRSSLHVPCRGENTRSKCPFKFDHNNTRYRHTFTDNTHSIARLAIFDSMRRALKG
ncbi:hypothetical protein GJD72_16030 [Klebsiella pneumoniae]|nr:hypothetical protein [Klebsiella pneumoniae]MTF65221.1 hypothetical protein [Klebsiella pneumoniae]MTF70883.1 hypothetical protein [Klebsiella pneumoniae]MTF96988.1 hypothetical protein [Klebsiella pneumoniae]MTG74796.1 hypothetical protein [Klebsiella pneumoniae]